MKLLLIKIDGQREEDEEEIIKEIEDRMRLMEQESRYYSEDPKEIKAFEYQLMVLPFQEPKVK